ncbi:hypothetical protein RJF_4780 [Candidozyma auris]|uniref:ER transporter 6TM N-terminal domain-containing protein n=1 Tax=Candidozyma auris TaxID=498019 RepID=A0A8F2W0I4_CANAR|nr:hypothetical protein CA7LBN_002264 [[Candida] auris]
MVASDDSVNEFTPQAIYGTEKEALDESQYNVYDDKKDDSGIEKPEPKSNLWRKAYSFFYPDWILKHTSRSDLKLVLQTWVQVWSTIFLCIVPRTDEWLGIACFLFQIMGFIMANGGLSVVINVSLAFMCSFYVCVAWLFIVVASAISAHLRGWPTQESVARSLIADGICTSENVSKCYQEQVTDGRFLDTRCTVIWVFAGLIAFTAFGMTRRYHPLMRLPFVAGAITTVIMTVNFVTLPTFIGAEVSMVIIKPFLLAFVFKIVCAFVVFPFTSSHTYLKAIIGIHDSLAATCEKNANFFKTIKPSLDNFNNHNQLASDVQASRVKLGPSEMFLISSRWEVSFSRFDTGDLAEIRSKIKPLLTVLAGFKYLYDLLDERKDVARDAYAPLKRKGSLSNQSFSDSHNKLLASFRHTYAKVGVFETQMRVQKLKDHFKETGKAISLHDLDVICSFMKEHYGEFLEEVPKTLKAVSAWLKAANSFRTYSLLRWSKHVNEQKKQNENLLHHVKKLRAEVQKLDEANETIKSLANRFDGEEQKLCLVSQSSLVVFFCKEIAQQIFSLCSVLSDLDETRPTPKVITMFSSTRHDKRVTINRDMYNDDPVGNAEGSSPNIVRHRDPDVLDPENLYQVVVINLFRVGWRVAVTRFVSVVIGLFVSLLASSFPKPRSSKVAVRMILSGVLESSNDMFSKISEFALKRIENSNIHIKVRHDEASDKMRSLLISLANARAMMNFIRYETAWTGNWPTETYRTLQTLVNDLIQLYYLIYISINQVQDTKEWMPIILDRLGWTNADLVAEVLALTGMSAGALRRKSPMPKITNANLTAKHFESVSEQWGVSSATLNERFYDEVESSSIRSDENHDDCAITQRHGKTVNYQKLLSHDGQINIVCLLLMHLAYQKIDDIVITVKSLVGEKYDVSEELFELRKWER